MNETQNTPELRFDGFTEPWKERRLGDVGHATSGVGFPDAEQGGSSGVPFFKVSDMNLRGNENEMTTANNYVSDSQISRLGWKPVADVPAMFFAKVGAAVALNRKRLVRMPFLMDNNTMAYSLRHEYWNAEYAKALFETLDLPSLAQTGALPSYNSSDVEDMVVLMPFNFDEQQTMGTFFSRLDALIALYQGRHERLQHLKQALLLKMFPKPGEQVPELRFDGFTEPWEERKLGELYVRAGSGGTPSSGDPRYYGGHIPFLGIADMDGRFITKTEKSLTDDGLSNSAAWIVPAGSISLAMYASVGKVGITCCDMATSQAFYNMVFDSTVTRDFVYSRLDRADCLSEWRSLISTGTQSNLNAQKVRDWAVAMPSLPEQHAIGSLFRELDDFITLQQRKYERLQHLKQALLRKMFV